MCDQRLRDGWIPDSENWPIVSSFYSFLINMKYGPVSVESYPSPQSLCWAPNNVCDLLAQHQRLPFPFLFSLARLTKQRFLGITSWAGHKEKRDRKRKRTASPILGHKYLYSLFSYEWAQDWSG